MAPDSGSEVNANSGSDVNDISFINDLNLPKELLATPMNKKIDIKKGF